MGNYIALVSKWKPVFVDGLIIFTPSIFLLHGFSDLEVRFSAKDDILLLLQKKERVAWLKRRAVRVDIVYKRKNQKVKLIDFDKSDGTKPEGYTDWKRRIIEVTQI